MRQSLSSFDSPSPDIGDFNLPSGTLGPSGTTKERNMLADLQQEANNFFLHQFITMPMHQAGIMLDLVSMKNYTALQLYQLIQQNHLIIMSLNVHKSTIQQSLTIWAQHRTQEVCTLSTSTMIMWIGTLYELIELQPGGMKNWPTYTHRRNWTNIWTSEHYSIPNNQEQVKKKFDPKVSSS